MSTLKTEGVIILFTKNLGASSRIESLVSGFDEQLKTLRSVDVPEVIMKVLSEIRDDLSGNIKKFESENKCKIRGLFPVIPFDEINIFELLSMIRTPEGAGIPRLSSFGIIDLTRAHFRPFVVLNPSTVMRNFGEKRRFATAQEIISYAILNGLTERALIAKSSECGGDNLCLRLNKGIPELSVIDHENFNGEVLSLLKRFII